jgi:hypothetical protein
VSASVSGTASGTLTLTGTAVPGGYTALGVLTLGGTSNARVAVIVLGALTLGAAGSAPAVTVALGLLVLGGTGTAGATQPASALGNLTLTGIAFAISGRIPLPPPVIVRPIVVARRDPVFVPSRPFGGIRSTAPVLVEDQPFLPR